MNRETVPFTTEAAWLAERAKDLTSTESAMLFGCSPYGTAYELHHVKTGELEKDFQDNDRTRWGRRLEAAIAYGIAEDHGLIVEPFKDYMRIPELRIGSSFDFRIIGIVEDWKGDENYFRQLFREHGAGLMEVKNVDGLAFKRSWLTGEENEAPPHIEFQAQHQMLVSDHPWVVIAPLVGGNTPSPFARLRDGETCDLILQKAADFWEGVDNGTPPDPDFGADADTIARLYARSTGEEIDLTDNDRVAELCAEHADAGKAEKDAKGRKDAAKAELLTIIGGAAKCQAAGFNISATEVQDNPGKLITPDMVGSYQGGRRGYRNFRIYPQK